MNTIVIDVMCNSRRVEEEYSLRSMGGGIPESEMLFHSLMGGGDLEESATIIGLTDLSHVIPTMERQPQRIG